MELFNFIFKEEFIMILFLLFLIVVFIVGIILFILGLPILPILLDLAIFCGIMKILFFRKKKD